MATQFAPPDPNLLAQMEQQNNNNVSFHGFAPPDPKLLDELNNPSIPTQAGQFVQQSLLPVAKQNLQDEGQALKDAGLGFGHGMLLGKGYDVTAGLMSAGLEKGQAALHNILPNQVPASPNQIDADLQSQGFTGDLNSSIGQTYRNAEQQSEQEAQAAQQRSPKAYLAGDIAGTVGSAIGTTGIGEATGLNDLLGVQKYGDIVKDAGTFSKALPGLAGNFIKNEATLLPMGAAYGALNSNANFVGGNDADKAKMLRDAENGAVTSGIIGGVAIPAAGSALKGLGNASSGVGNAISDYVQDSPFLRQLGGAFKTGLQGQGYTGDQAAARDLIASRGAAEDATNSLFSVRDKLGGMLRAYVNDATQQGKSINFNENQLNDLTDFMNLGKQDIGTNFYNELAPYAQQLEQGGSLNPNDAWKLKQVLREFGSTYSDDQLGQKALAAAGSVNSAINTSLSDSNEFNTLNKYYSKFLDAGPETLINKGVSQQNAERYLSDTTRGRPKVFNEIQGIINKLGETNAGGDTQKTTFNMLNQQLSDYDSQFPGLLKNMGFDKDQFMNNIANQADQTNISRMSRGSGMLFGGGDTGFMSKILGQGTYGGANLAGRAANLAATPVLATSNMSKNLYNATNDELTGMAQSLLGNKSTETLGQSLSDAIKNNDTIKKNAMIFTILQRPDAREKITVGNGSNGM